MLQSNPTIPAALARNRGLRKRECFLRHPEGLECLIGVSKTSSMLVFAGQGCGDC